jgi:two-component system chemotaxis response regulator CheY
MRILIADDDATSRHMLEAIATKLGHECLTAADASAAWDHLSSSTVDVLLTDWMMLGVDGPELCRRVRHELDAQYVYIVLITALENHQHVLEGMSAAADDYLVKPVDPFSVRTRLIAAERVIELHRQLVDAQAKLVRATADATERTLTDTLTGLSNRRRMEEDLADMYARALRLGRTYGVALLDIDHFKAYNDRYGHLNGDEILRRVAHRFVNDVRASERIYRYGGEEFLLLMDDCTHEGATVAAERLRLAVEDLEIPHESRPDSPPSVTLSGGVACWDPASTQTIPELLEGANRALFEAKSAGRNCVRTADEPVSIGHRA